MKREAIDCDKCQKECTKDHIHLEIPNGITRDSGGHTTEIIFDYEKIDICPKCAGQLLTFMFRQRRIEKEDGTVAWEAASVHNHPNSKQNDAIGIALWFFKIKEKANR